MVTCSQLKSLAIIFVGVTLLCLIINRSDDKKSQFNKTVEPRKLQQYLQVPESDMGISYQREMQNSLPQMQQRIHLERTDKKQKDTQQELNSQTIKDSDINKYPFVFHNKVPKCGSSTMNRIITTLSKSNGFNFRLFNWNEQQEKAKGREVTDPSYIFDIVKKEFKPPFLLNGHHFWMDFEKSGMKPAYINVIRHPIDHLTSNFYFNRFGWGLSDAHSKNSDNFSIVDIDECVKHWSTCRVTRGYMSFFCGEKCTNTTDPAEKLRISKQMLVDEFLIVGILEQFDDTLLAFEALLPQYFNSALEVSKQNEVIDMKNKSATSEKKTMSQASREYLESGPLKYDLQFYEFAREIFNEKLKLLEIKSTAS